MKKLFLSMAVVGLGTFAIAQQTESLNMKTKRGDAKQNMEMRQQKKLDNMKSMLNLNDDQVMKIKALQEERAKERQVKMAANKEDAISNKVRRKEEMKKILTTEQFTKWENSMKEKKGKAKNRKMTKKKKSPSQTKTKQA